MESTWQEAKSKKARKCIVCGQLGAAASKKSSGSMAPPDQMPKQCSFCLLFWHSRCADGITEKLRDSIRTGEAFGDSVRMSATLASCMPTLPEFVTSMLLNDQGLHNTRRPPLTLDCYSSFEGSCYLCMLCRCACEQDKECPICTSAMPIVFHDAEPDAGL